MESVSENLLMNISIKNRTAAENKNHDMSNSCCLRDTLQLQHSTNLNIQRSQSTHRFNANGPDTNRDPAQMTSSTNYEEPTYEDYINDPEQAVAPICENSDSNYLEETPEVLPAEEPSEEEGEEDDDEASTTKEANNRANLALPVASRSDTSESSSLVTNMGSLTMDNAGLVPPAPAPNKPCEYLKLVMGFKRTLMLPDVFFTADPPQCFCECAGAVNGSWKSKSLAHAE